MSERSREMALCVVLAVRPTRHQRDRRDDANDDEGVRSLFASLAAASRHPRHTPTTYGSTSGQSQAGSQPIAARGPSVDAAEPSVGVHVTGRRHRGQRSHSAQTQPTIEDV